MLQISITMCLPKTKDELEVAWVSLLPLKNIFRSLITSQVCVNPALFDKAICCAAFVSLKLVTYTGLKADFTWQKLLCFCGQQLKILF